MTLAWGRGRIAAVLAAGLLVLGAVGVAGCGGGDDPAPTTASSEKVEAFRASATELCEDALQGFEAPPKGEFTQRQAKKWARRSVEPLDGLAQALTALVESGKAVNQDVEPLRVLVLQIQSAGKAARGNKEAAPAAMQRSSAELQAAANAIGVPACAPQ